MITMKATVLKEIKDLNKWRDLSCSWVRRLNIVKLSIPFKLVSTFIIIPINSQKAFFLVEINKMFLVSVWKHIDLEKPK